MTTDPGTQRFSVRLRLIAGLIAVAVIALFGYIACRQLRAFWHYRQAESALARRDWTAARRHLRICVDEWPDSGETRFLAARTARRDGDLESADSLLAESARLGWVNEQIELEKTLLRIQRGQSSIGRLLDFLRRDHPDSAVIAEVVVPAAIRQFDLMAADEAAVIWHRRDSSDPRPLLARGDVHERLRNREIALVYYREAVAIDGAFPAARLRLGKILLDLNQPREALDQFEILAAKGDISAVVRRGKARCQIELGQPELAVSEIESLLQETPEDGELLALRGRIELDQNRPADALSWLERSLEMPPVEGPTLHLLARCYDLLRRDDDAARLRKRIQREEAGQSQAKEVLQRIASRPGDPEPRCELAMILSTHGLDREAEAWLVSALNLDERRGPTHEALAALYRSRGDEVRSKYHENMAKRATLSTPVRKAR